jgi:hypothetical protein
VKGVWPSLWVWCIASRRICNVTWPTGIGITWLPNAAEAGRRDTPPLWPPWRQRGEESARSALRAQVPRRRPNYAGAPRSKVPRVLEQPHIKPWTEVMKSWRHTCKSLVVLSLPSPDSSPLRFGDWSIKSRPDSSADGEEEFARCFSRRAQIVRDRWIAECNRRRRRRWSGFCDELQRMISGGWAS